MKSAGTTRLSFAIHSKIFTGSAFASRRIGRSLTGTARAGFELFKRQELRGRIRASAAHFGELLIRQFKGAAILLLDERQFNPQPRAAAHAAGTGIA